jgi:Asp-tRNA(Asn)/Glu-tRNA(Gln) amidotransferase A subunit family amidase
MWEEAEPTTAAALDHASAAFERAGARVAEIAIPPEHRGLTAAQDTVMGFELVRGLAFERLQHSAELSPRLAQLLDAGMSVGADAYDAACAETEAARARLDGFFGPCEAMLVPAAPGEAPAGLGYTGNPVFSRMWTLLGVPCVTLPAIWGEGGLPTGIQLVGRPGHDAQLMAAALFAERALAEAA